MDDSGKGGERVNYKYHINTPVGIICVEANEEAVTGLYIEKNEIFPKQEKPETALLKKAGIQLEEYFSRKRKVFDLPLAPSGTVFQKKVWEALCTIPYGETRSYGEIAAQIGNPKAYRAVGGANNKNPIMIFIPCHRVIGADGSLVGFGGGIDAKKFMLDLERKV
ncbi:methylated-DNA-[protein]-cysteine S-methyltransferase [Lachnospiraceae bacterium 10-1]|nr:methylated-DNA-[protein]-cysteine S-methyltransferase [Lachnospiraceae bacterium 10-1]